MFSNVGWGEILVLLIVGLFLIGPERLPGLIREVRAGLLAIRNAVDSAKEQLDGEIGEDFREFSKPLQELNAVRQMGAKGFITKTLLEGDDSYLKALDGTKQDVKNTVESLRSPLSSDASTPQRPDVEGTSSAPGKTPGVASSVNTGGAPGAAAGVEVPQQASMGESRLQGGQPVQDAGSQLSQRADTRSNGWEDVL